MISVFMEKETTVMNSNHISQKSVHIVTHSTSRAFRNCAISDWCKMIATII